uniref:GDP-mannose 4,6-dehydratase n=1 Tax=viral metagenome TaxID=1070528 RepID=A0A6C0J4U3_9ZZZZ
MSKKYALITGVTGQDGSYLGEFLLKKNYTVYGIIRRSSTFNTSNIEHYRNKLKLMYGDLTDLTSLCNVLHKIKKVIGSNRLEIYHLAAQSHVGISFEIPIYTAHCDAVGTLHLLEAIKMTDMLEQSRLYNAATSELFGEVLQTPQNEMTPFNPVSPYAIAKQYGFYMIKNYREAYNMFACSGILFNHESERRGFNFVTRKITLGIGKIMKNEIQYIELGNIDALRDWGHAKDYIKAMFLMLQKDTPVDYVIGSGKQHSVRDFVECAFKVINKEIEWTGKGVDEIGRFKDTGQIVIKINPIYYRPCEVNTLLSDPQKGMVELKWKPEISFIQMVESMVKNDIK